MNTKITIKAKDLDTPEKAETFMSLFGRSSYYKAMTDLAVQVNGDGALEKLMAMAEPLNLSNAEDEKRYEKLRVRMEKESARLIPKEKASIEIEVGDMVAENLFQRRETAKEFLGKRYTEALFPFGDLADNQSLRAYNPYLREFKPETFTSKNNALESQKSRLRESELQKIDNL